MKPANAEDNGIWIITQGSAVWTQDGELPQGNADQYRLTGMLTTVIGEWQGQTVRAILSAYPVQVDYTPLRSLLSLPKPLFQLLNRAVELHYFLQTHQFCGKCGSKNAVTTNEWAVECQNSACRHRTYPVICPSIIVAVRKGKQILLACHQRHRDSKMYTTLAGFVEVGETFEQAVVREVWEESAIKIKNLRYYGSQAWAFPNSQMVAFLADYAEGDIKIQESELYDAAWFDYDQPLPSLPPKGTIALELIETTLQLCRKENDR